MCGGDLKLRVNRVGAIFKIMCRWRVAASISHLVKRAGALLDGHKVRAFYLRIWLEGEDQVATARGECPWEEDWAYCQAVCEQAGVPLEAVSLQKEYQERVVSYLVDESAAGRTPNPDIMCNSRIKFGVFHDRVGRHFAKEGIVIDVRDNRLVDEEAIVLAGQLELGLRPPRPTAFSW